MEKIFITSCNPDGSRTAEFNQFMEGFKASHPGWTFSHEDPAVHIHFGDADPNVKKYWDEPFIICVMDHLPEYDIPAFHVGHYYHSYESPVLSFSCDNRLRCAPYEDAHAKPGAQRMRGHEFILSKAFWGGVVVPEKINTFADTNWYNVGYQAGVAQALMLEDEDDEARLERGMPF